MYSCTYYVVEGKCTRVYLCYLAQGQRRTACELELRSLAEADDDDSRPAAAAAAAARVRGLFIYLTRQNSSKQLRVFSVEDTHRTRSDVFSFWYIMGINLSLSYLLEYMGIGARELFDSIHRWSIVNSQSEKYKYESRVIFICINVWNDGPAYLLLCSMNFMRYRFFVLLLLHLQHFTYLKQKNIEIDRVKHEKKAAHGYVTMTKLVADRSFALRFLIILSHRELDAEEFAVLDEEFHFYPVIAAHRARRIGGGSRNTIEKTERAEKARAHLSCSSIDRCGGGGAG
ncbi:unnamed protein product [Trichogramma brassicae]|uniref:Uncharacterized protein n=1 Tax=Trichogramma brassicae TaxID=86971 RepID=A0A6H5HXE9_9HYME|nr:unnamed protein product [Trichogramma brassicae]